MTMTPITIPAMAPPDSPPVVSKVQGNKHSYKYSQHWQYQEQQNILPYLTPFLKQQSVQYINSLFLSFTLIPLPMEIISLSLKFKL